MPLGAAIRDGSLSHFVGFPLWSTFHQHRRSHPFPSDSTDARAAHPTAEPQPQRQPQRTWLGCGFCLCSFLGVAQTVCWGSLAHLLFWSSLQLGTLVHPKDAKTYCLLAMTAWVSCLPSQSQRVSGNYAQSFFFNNNFYWSCWNKKNYYSAALLTNTKLLF